MRRVYRYGKNTAWYVKWPDSFYAEGPIRYTEPVYEWEVRQDLLRSAYAGTGRKRLPAGTAVYPTLD